MPPSIRNQNPEDLWRALDSFQEKTGSEVIAIPHNGNLSNGRMFSVNKFDGTTPYDRELAALRAGLEPIYEATQIKGDGEAHPFLSPDDEFADYETWDIGNLDVSEAKNKDMLAGEYAREALKRGLALQENQTALAAPKHWTWRRLGSGPPAQSSSPSPPAGWG